MKQHKLKRNNTKDHFATLHQNAINNLLLPFEFSVSSQCVKVNKKKDKFHWLDIQASNHKIVVAPQQRMGERDPCHETDVNYKNNDKISI